MWASQGSPEVLRCSCMLPAMSVSGQTDGPARADGSGKQGLPHSGWVSVRRKQANLFAVFASPLGALEAVHLSRGLPVLPVSMATPGLAWAEGS